jgi:hypothetical protein
MASVDADSGASSSMTMITLPLPKALHRRLLSTRIPFSLWPNFSQKQSLWTMVYRVKFIGWLKMVTTIRRKAGTMILSRSQFEAAYYHLLLYFAARWGDKSLGEAFKERQDFGISFTIRRSMNQVRCWAPQPLYGKSTN